MIYLKAIDKAIAVGIVLFLLINISSFTYCVFKHDNTIKSELGYIIVGRIDNYEDSCKYISRNWTKDDDTILLHKTMIILPCGKYQINDTIFYNKTK